MLADVDSLGRRSGPWTATGGGKEVVFDTYLVPPDWTDVPIVLDGPATVVLECFIDQSHTGAQVEQREGMAATDISIEAVTEIEDNGDNDGDTDTDGDTDADDDTDKGSADDNSDDDPTPVPTAVPAGTHTLPKTGPNLALLTMAGVGLLGIGAALALRRRPTY
jgi:LPXTG-motif cell wall-anchored protein